MTSITVDEVQCYGAVCVSNGVSASSVIALTSYEFHSKNHIFTEIHVEKFLAFHLF